MAEKLKIISLGGLNEIGKNLTVYEYGKDILVVDCGMGFPDDDMYGIDMVIPDFTYLVKNKERVRGVVITHGHEDHIGGVPYLLREINVPIYATPLTAGLINIKLVEHGLDKTAKMNVVKAGDAVKAGCFKVELIHVNHSIADAVALAIKTPVGMVVHTGDFKLDITPVSGGMMDLARLGQLGKEGVMALVQDSTNVGNAGWSQSESLVAENLDNQFKGCDERIIVTTFASNIHRIQEVIDCAARYKRKVGITGRSMENIMKVGAELGYINAPPNTIVEMNQLKGLPKNKVVIITTGSQGETMSALYRMAFSGHKQVEIGAGDRVIISASAIPGNEVTVGRIINELFRKGADVAYDKNSLHASGHANQEELKLMMALTKPKFFIPIHGEQRHLKKHAALAQKMGIESKNIVISDIGKVIETTGRSVRINGVVPSGRVLVDGVTVGGVGPVVLRDRKHLASDGMIVVIVNLDAEDGSLLSGPDIITRGFVYVKESEQLMQEMKKVVNDTLETSSQHGVGDWASLKSNIKGDLSNYLYRSTKRNPMILPVIMEI